MGHTTSHVIADEFLGAQFGDERLSQRSGIIATAAAVSPGSSIPAAAGSLAATKATYRFYDSSGVTPEAILHQHIQRTADRCADEQVVLMIQDTTPMKFPGRSVTGLGGTSRAHIKGIMLHSGLAVSLSGVPLGILAQHQWVRPGRSKDYDPAPLNPDAHKKLPTNQKEPQIWLDVRQAARQALPASVRMIAIADREADFYEYIALLPEGTDCVIRLGQDRSICQETQRLKALMASSPVAGSIDVQINRANDRLARTARLTVRYQTLEIKAPSRRKGSLPLPPTIIRQVILAREENPPKDQPAIEWLLLTSLPVESLEDAQRIIGYYSQRWLIERFHYTLKSGMKIQELQLETRHRLGNAIAMYSVVAWHLMFILYHARAHPDQSCEAILSPAQWQILYLHEHRRTGTQLPTTPPSNREATLWIAKLGGFLARKGDGSPGIKTLWRGLLKLNERTDAYLDTLRLVATSADALMGNA